MQMGRRGGGRSDPDRDPDHHRLDVWRARCVRGPLHFALCSAPLCPAFRLVHVGMLLHAGSPHPGCHVCPCIQVAPLHPGSALVRAPLHPGGLSSTRVRRGLLHTLCAYRGYVPVLGRIQGVEGPCLTMDAGALYARTHRAPIRPASFARQGPSTPCVLCVLDVRPGV